MYKCITLSWESHFSMILILNFDMNEASILWINLKRKTKCTGKALHKVLFQWKGIFSYKEFVWLSKSPHPNRRKKVGFTVPSTVLKNSTCRVSFQSLTRIQQTQCRLHFTITNKDTPHSMKTNDQRQVQNLKFKM